MSFQQLSPGYAVSAQLSPFDLARLKEQGVTTLVCNRPDGEEPGQPSQQIMRHAAQAAGIAFYSIPMAGPVCTQQQTRNLAEIMANSPGLVLGYCRSGRRSALLWQCLQREAL